jgi:hypothetical protein
MQLTPPPYQPPAPGEPPSNGPAPRRRQPTTPGQKWAILAIAAGAGLLAALTSGAAPTMWEPADLFWRWFAAAGVALCASRSRRWTLVWMTVPAAALSTGSAQVTGVIALVAAIGIRVQGTRDRRLRTAIGGLGAVALLSLSPPWPLDVTGLSALIAVVAAVPVIWSARRRARPVERRRAVGVLAGLGVACVVGSVAAVVLVATSARGALDAVEASNRAVEQASSDDVGLTVSQFEDAAGRFRDLSRGADAWWFVPARAVPIIGANVNLARTAFSAGAELNRTAANLAAEVDQDSLSLPDQGLNLAVLASFESPARNAAEAISTARSDLEVATGSPWVLPPLRSELDGIDESLAEAGNSADIAAQAARVIPGMLGADGRVRYLLLLGNPAELRDVGGHLGNWAEIVVDDGRVDLVEVGSPYDLFSPNRNPPPVMTGGVYPESLEELRPQYFPQNWGGSPDMDAVARLAAELFPQARPGPPIAGVIYADPTAFAALLEVTGGVPVAGTDVVLSADNAVQFLTRDQFAALADVPGDPVGDAIEVAVRRFTDSPFPRPQRLVSLFDAVAEGGHLQMSAFTLERNALLDRIGLRRTLQRQGQEDILSVVNRNANPSKIDAFLRREVTYSVGWQPGTGQVRSVVTVRLVNDVPPTGLDDLQVQPPPATQPGTNRTQLSILSPLAAVEAHRDGQPVPFGTQAESPSVFRHNLFVELAPGESTILELNLTGLSDPGFYRLHWLGQPTIDPAPTTVRIHELNQESTRVSNDSVEQFPATDDRVIIYDGGQILG